MNGMKKRVMTWALTAMAVIMVSLGLTVTVMAASLSTPRIKSVRENNWGALCVTWNKVKKAKEYDVYMRVGNKPFKLIQTVESPICLVSADYGSEYAFKVRAIGEGAKSGYSDTRSISLSTRSYIDAYRYLAKTVTERSSRITGRVADSFTGKRGKEYAKKYKNKVYPVKGKVKIYCDKMTNELLFLYEGNVDGAGNLKETDTCEMRLRPTMVTDTETESPVTVRWSMVRKRKSKVTGAIKASMQFQMDSLNLGKLDQFSYESATGYTIPSERARKVGDSILNNAFDEWQRLLIKETAMTLDDIGFEELDNFSFNKDK